MNKNPTIIQFDEEKYYVSVVDLMLYGTGLSILKAATDRASANMMIREIQQGMIKPDIAIVDTIIADDHGEGTKIGAWLRENVPGIKIIAYTILRDEEHAWADKIAIKSHRDPGHTLLKALSELLGMELGGGDLDVS